MIPSLELIVKNDHAIFQLDITPFKIFPFLIHEFNFYINKYKNILFFILKF